MKMILFSILTGFILVGVFRQDHDNNQTDYQTDRNKMVNDQIEGRGIKDERVLRAMRMVPRHEFVPQKLRKYAYTDEPLPIGEDQTISQPYIVAYMTEKLQLKSTDKVLEIGTGSGYQAAILAEIADSVFTIEIIESLARSAEERLKKLGYENVYCLAGDGYAGWPEHSPFDAIIITAAPPVIPQPLVDQLAVSGRMVLPLGEAYQELLLLTKNEKGISKKELIPVRFVPMTGEIMKN